MTVIIKVEPGYALKEMLLDLIASYKQQAQKSTESF